MQVLTTHTEAIGRKYPESVVIAIAKDREGKYNPITLGWSMITSGQPPMMAISVGLGRHSLEAIRSAKEFVISFPSAEMAEDALFFGTRSGRDTDKLAARNAPTQPASEVDCVILSDAVANFECKLASELVTGDHVIFVGRIVASHVNQNDKVQRLYTLGKGYKLGAIPE